MRHSLVLCGIVRQGLQLLGPKRKRNDRLTSSSVELEVGRIIFYECNFFWGLLLDVSINTFNT